MGFAAMAGAACDGIGVPATGQVFQIFVVQVGRHCDHEAGRLFERIGI
jgi:hypothetical protein